MLVVSKQSTSKASTTTLAAATSIFDSSVFGSPVFETPVALPGHARADVETDAPPHAENRKRHDAIERSVGDLYEQMSGPMLAYLRSLGLFDSDAGDVIQETFLRLMQHMRAGRPEGNLRAWLYQVAYTQAMDIHRFDTRFSSLSDEADDAKLRQKEPLEYCPSPEDALIANEKIQRVRVALKFLPIKQRQCVMLRSEGLRYREIAGNLGVSTQRVATLMERGVSRLAAIL